jgi:hypothetical protein
MSDEALRLIQAMTKRPAMYVEPVEPATVENYLRGMRVGLALSGVVSADHQYEEAASARGWKFRDASVVWHMRQAGLDEDAIVSELFHIQADAFRIGAGE